VKQKRKTIPRVGDKVVLSDHPTAQVYTVTEVASVAGGTRLVAQLMYISEYGMHCNAGGVDVSSLMTPSDEQLTTS
jgi:hypothetical protein